MKILRPFALLFATLFSLGLGFTALVCLFKTFVYKEPLLFEAIVLFSFSVIIMTITTIAGLMSDTITIFSDILKKQSEIQSSITKQNPISGLFGGIIGQNPNSPEGSVKITKLSDPDNPKTFGISDLDNNPHPLAEFFDRLYKSKKEITDMNMDELKQELKKATEKEDFEKAAKVKEEIEARENNKNN